LINASRIKEEQCYRDQKIDSYRKRSDSSVVSLPVVFVYYFN
jgi:hypothetical protein